MLGTARARQTRSIDSLCGSILPVSPTSLPLHISFCAPFYRTVATQHFYLNLSRPLAPTRFAPTSHSVLSTRLTPQTTRLRLTQLNKLRCEPSFRLEAARREGGVVREPEFPTSRGLTET
jgi:hypothetical protein